MALAGPVTPSESLWLSTWGLKPEQVGLEGGSFCERGQYMVLAGPVTPSESLRLSTWGLKPEQVGLEGGASVKGDSTWC